MFEYDIWGFWEIEYIGNGYLKFYVLIGKGIKFYQQVERIDNGN